ncbi:MAG: aminoacyl-tRNA hydrolase [Myxococcales bacterium]|nr:aminoacyl-tRNA hydrolase [Myxococcales bacterium]
MERTLVVGLGNPGPQYVNTRHNIGFIVVDRLADQLGISLSQEKFNGTYGQGRLSSGEPVTLLKPKTFMNLSGKSVAPCAKFFKIPPTRIIVVHDELEFPFSTLKVKIGGGHAGHNGLKSIDALMGTKDFIRIRVGIGRPKRGAVSDYVLANFSADEQAWLDQVCKQAANDIQTVIQNGARKAMNTIHARPLLVTL